MEILTVLLLPFEIQKKMCPSVQLPLSCIIDQISQTALHHSQAGKQAKGTLPSQRAQDTTFSQGSKPHQPLKAACKRALPGAMTGLETPCREGYTSREGILVQMILESPQGAHTRDEQVFRKALQAIYHPVQQLQCRLWDFCNGTIPRSLYLPGSPLALHQLYSGKLNLPSVYIMISNTVQMLNYQLNHLVKSKKSENTVLRKG